jgi:hypothetical protein
MYAALCRGRERCTEEALRLMSDFVQQHQDTDGGFVNRAGQPDLYYSMFALLLAAVLRVPMRRDAVSRYLDGIDPGQLDLVHLLCLVRCRKLLAFLKSRAIPRSLRKHAEALLESRDGALFPLQDAASPYSQFLKLSLAQELAIPFSGQSLDAYRCNDGLFSNLRNDQHSSTNATSAALALAHYGFCSLTAGALPNFVALQQGDGAFKAARGAPQTDLLSTATAFFALSLHQQKPPLPVRDFLYSAFTAEGGFSSGLEDSLADLEYTAYGLLLAGLM